ncbi:hypothetical protein [Streptomyces poonensis]|uniref:Lipoprotein n=1 Tax=Streptomyces poonensis TaxID=68255 RepID=A0A918P984_9ACTN|nr:hypothetical protein [Streptomyces poonensis]GGY90105.1 hypothetical protein GCM10010365_05600 [Streptomyces poonensis]GLJ88003.1 hypothetical protein GCM10017589_06030 [Streptomyces poonensis]
MRGTARRTWAAGLAMVAMTAGLAACTGERKDEPESGGKSADAVVKACADGTFTWTGVRRTDRLTGASEVRRVGAEDASNPPMERVYTPRPAVRAEGPAVPAAEVLFSLGKRIGEIDSDARTLAEAGGDTYAFTDVRLAAPKLDGGRVEVTGPGEFVEYAGVREWEGDFRYTCSGAVTTTGHARNWTVDIGGVLSCQEPVGGDGLALRAARRSCGADSPAVRER